MQPLRTILRLSARAATADGFPEALRAALADLRAALEPHGVIDLEIQWVNGGWKIPRCVRERRVITAEAIEL